MRNAKQKVGFVLVSFIALCCPALAGAIEIAEVLDGNAPGTLLVYPQFDVSPEYTTHFRITNHSEPDDVRVKLNYICPGVPHGNSFCDALDREIVLTPYETRVIDVRDHNPPCDEGFIVAFAINDYGHLINWDHLTGSYHLTKGRRQQSDNAIAFQSKEFDADGSTAEGCHFGDYQGGEGQTFGALSALPTEHYTDFRSILVQGDRFIGSMLILLTLDMEAGSLNPTANVSVDFWNSAEEPFSSSLEFVCWGKWVLDDIDLNFFEENLGTTYGSMRLSPNGNCPVPGGCPPFEEYKAPFLAELVEYGPGMRIARNLHHDDVPMSALFLPR